MWINMICQALFSGKNNNDDNNNCCCCDWRKYTLLHPDHRTISTMLFRRDATRILDTCEFAKHILYVRKPLVDSECTQWQEVMQCSVLQPLNSSSISGIIRSTLPEVAHRCFQAPNMYCFNLCYKQIREVYFALLYKGWQSYLDTLNSWGIS